MIVVKWLLLLWLGLYAYAIDKHGPSEETAQAWVRPLELTSLPHVTSVSQLQVVALRLTRNLVLALLVNGVISMASTLWGNILDVAMFRDHSADFRQYPASVGFWVTLLCVIYAALFNRAGLQPAMYTFTLAVLFAVFVRSQEAPWWAALVALLISVSVTYVGHGGARAAANWQNMQNFADARVVPKLRTAAAWAAPRVEAAGYKAAAAAKRKMAQRRVSAAASRRPKSSLGNATFRMTTSTDDDDGSSDAANDDD